MKYAFIALLFSASAIAAPQDYDREVAKVRAEHQKVVERECIPAKRKDVEVCRKEANETLRQILADLRKRYGVK